MRPIETQKAEYNGWTISAHRYEGRAGWIGVAVRERDGWQICPEDGSFDTAENALARGRILADNCP